MQNPRPFFVWASVILVLAAHVSSWAGEADDLPPDKNQTPALRVLARLGMDVGLLDALQDKGQVEPECFYRMLAAVGRAKPGQLQRLADEELEKQGKKRFSVVPLFNDPAGQRGRLVSLSGNARRVVEVRVQDSGIAERFGINHYYEIYLFTNDSQSNPLVFCVRELPEGMPTGSDPQYSQQVEVAGFFLQTWRYRPELADELGGDPNKLQLAPLLIGREPRWMRPDAAAGKNPWYGLATGMLFIAVLALIWLAIWRSARKDRRFKQDRLRKVEDGLT